MQEHGAAGDALASAMVFEVLGLSAQCHMDRKEWAQAAKALHDMLFDDEEEEGDSSDEDEGEDDRHRRALKAGDATMYQRRPCVLLTHFSPGHPPSIRRLHIRSTDTAVACLRAWASCLPRALCSCVCGTHRTSGCGTRKTIGPPGPASTWRSWSAWGSATRR